jgi:hypothetical protein
MPHAAFSSRIRYSSPVPATAPSSMQTKRRPIDLFEEEQPHLLPLPGRAYDTARVLYRTVDSDGHIAYLQNFYSVPWQRIGELLPVRASPKTS